MIDESYGLYYNLLKIASNTTSKIHVEVPICPQITDFPTYPFTKQFLLFTLCRNPVSPASCLPIKSPFFIITAWLLETAPVIASSRYRVAIIVCCLTCWGLSDHFFVWSTPMLCLSPCRVRAKSAHSSPVIVAFVWFHSVIGLKFLLWVTRRVRVKTPYIPDKRIGCETI